METTDRQITSEAAAAPRKSIWDLTNLSWRTLGRRVWIEIYEGILLTHAAALSFYFFLSLFPLILFLITILGFFAEAGTELRSELLSTLSRIIPRSASTLIYTTVDEIAQNADGSKLSFGFLTALWIASSGMGAITEALNAMYGVKESRPWWKVRLASIGLTIALAVLIISALLLILYGGEVGEAMTNYFNQTRDFVSFWVIAQVPVVLAFVLFTFAMIYYFSPNLYDQKWYWITPGSLIGILLWLAISFLFRLYLRYFDSYSATYGALGAVIVLMLWFYLTGISILIGGKINAEIEGAAAEVGMPGAKQHGEKSV